MGQCYENEQIKSKSAAIRCFRRAVDSGDREGGFNRSGYMELMRLTSRAVVHHPSQVPWTSRLGSEQSVC